MQTAKEKIRVRYPLWLILLLSLAYGLVWLYFKLFYRLVMTGREVNHQVTGPCVVLGNHCAPVDFMLMTMALFPRRIHFVISNVFLATWWGPWIVKFLQQIPKSQFFAETRSVVQMKRVVAAGGSIGIYPEGRMSVHGRTGYVAPAIGKLVKSFGVPVILVKEQGVGLMRPLGAAHRRYFGRIEVKASILLTQQEVDSLDGTAIQQRICQGLNYGDYAWQQATHTAFYGLGLAEHLDWILHRCPACGRDHRMKSHKSELFCVQCGFRVKADAYGRLSLRPRQGFQPADWRQPALSLVFPTTLDLWYDWQLQVMKDLLRLPDYSYQVHMTLAALSKENFKVHQLGQGTLSLCREGIRLKGQLSSDLPEEGLLFAAGRLPTLTGTLGEFVDLPTAATLYRPCFADPGETIFWMQAAEAMFALQQDPSPGLVERQQTDREAAVGADRTK